MSKKPSLIRCFMSLDGESFNGAFLSMKDVDLFLHQAHTQQTGLVKVLGWSRETYYVRPSSVSLFNVRDNGHRDPQFPLPPIDDDDYFDPGAP